MRVALAILAILLATLFVISLFVPEPEARRAGLALPAGEVVPEPREGQRLFSLHCAQCHGTELQGTEQGPPLLSPLYHPNHHSDLAFRLAVRNGVHAHHWSFGNMPPIPEVTNEGITHLVAFIREQQRRAGIID